MVATRIFADDSIKEAASKIYNDFLINQSCTICGFERIEEFRLEEKGLLVCNELRRLDSVDNLRPMGKKMTRRRKILPDSIGGYVAHKIFKFKRVIVESEVRYTIWRVQ